MSDPSTPPQKSQPRNLTLPADLELVYSNMVRISHTPGEMIFDFGRFFPPDPTANVVSRVVMSPLGAKLFLTALNENIAKYEANFGEIKLPQKHSLADSLFRPPPETDHPKQEEN